MPTIFLSYRRQDTVSVSGRIYHADSIPPGLDFRKQLDARLRAGDRVGNTLSVRQPFYLMDVSAR